MADINLHFTGDFAALAAANNLLAALIDNHIHHGNVLDIDMRRSPGSACSTSTTARCGTSSSVWAASPTATRARTASTSSWPRS